LFYAVACFTPLLVLRRHPERSEGPLYFVVVCPFICLIEKFDGCDSRFFSFSQSPSENTPATKKGGRTQAATFSHSTVRK
jgi:hypothetical protein